MTRRLRDETVIERRPRNTCLGAQVILGILTVLFIVAWAGGITFLMASCEQESLCSDEVTSLVELASLALLAVIVFPLNRALGRAMGIGKSDDSVSAKAPAITSELNRQIQGRAVLSFGQSRIAGNVQSVDVAAIVLPWTECALDVGAVMHFVAIG